MYKFIDERTGDVIFETSSFKDLILGMTIEYKTFRINGDYGAPFYDYILKVSDVKSCVQMGWNSVLRYNGTNVYVSVIHKVEVKLEETK